MELNENLIYSLDSTSTSDVASLLSHSVDSITKLLKDNLNNDYEIISGKVDQPGDSWTHTVKVRKGNSVGVAVELSWTNNNPGQLQVSVEESSKLGNIILWGAVVPFAAAGFYMGVEDIEPLAFLPGEKIAAALGALMGMTAGAIIGTIIKSLVIKKADQKESDALVTTITSLLNEHKK